MTFHYSQNVSNATLRIATVSSRFLFIIFLAKFIEPKWVGYYGIFTAAIGFTVLFVGLDFYTYANRAIIRSQQHERGRMLKTHITLTSSMYVLVIPIAVTLTLHFEWPGLLIWWFIPILILEHFNQEVSRLLIALSYPIWSSLLLFLRQGSWAISTVVIMTIIPETRRMDLIFPAWAISGFIAALIGIWKIKHLELGGWTLHTDWVWIKNGITISVVFFIATLSLRFTQFIDRIWLEALGGIETVAAYVVLFGIANTLMIILQAGVFAFAYPQLVKFAQSNEFAQANTLVWRTFLQTLIISFTFAIVSWLCLPIILPWFDNPIYQENSHLYPWLMCAVAFQAVGMVPHYGLYAYGKDQKILESHLLGAVVFGVATWLLSHSLSALAVPIGLTLSFLSILFWKARGYMSCRIKKSES